MVAAGVLSAPVATPALGIGARSLWKAGLFRQDAWKERTLSQATPDTTRIPSLGGTVWSRALKFKSIKWAKPFFLDSQSFAFLQSYPGKARRMLPAAL